MYSAYFFFQGICIIIYLWLIGQIIYGWKKTKTWKTDSAFIPKSFVSIIVPARNEEANVKSVLECLANQSLSKSFYEIVFVDDHSTDQTFTIAKSCKSPNLKIFSLDNSTGEISGKKAAIAFGVSRSKGEIIVTVDADCYYGPLWLTTMLSCFEKNELESLSGSVLIREKDSLLHCFQSLDVMGSVAIMAAGIHNKSHFMAFGANFMYSKGKFQRYLSSGWRPEIATGDDMFLVESIALENDHKVGFLKNNQSMAISSAESGINALLNQRKRWASKSKSYNHHGLQKLLIITFVFNLFIWLNLLLSLCFGIKFFWIAACLLLLKMGLDYLVLRPVANYFEEKLCMKYFIQNVFLHSLYIILLGFYSLFFKKYTWKDRLHN